MGLEIGSRFGAYEIAEPIGAGGMGEVYRAHDSNLKRDVAVKVLPREFAEDADRVARFQREAEALAALNHLNIAQVYGLERQAGNTVIVMELIDGPTLAERVADGALPVEEALVVAHQVIDALEAAHGRGIVHRDLKPANIKLRADGVVKVLDFGISTAPESPLAASGRSSPTRLTPALTEAGILLGTAAYMAPEQARGRAVDERADIWAFGCLLYEMLTGQPAFEGEDVTTTLARVLEREVNVASLPSALPPIVKHTLGLCLEKDPAKRIADIRDVRLALAGRFATQAQHAGAGEAVRHSPWRRRLLLVAALLLGIGITSVAAWTLRPVPERPITRFTIELAGAVGENIGSSLTMSPDGQRIVYVANDQLYSHRLDQNEPTVIPGTQGGVEAFFSPDGESIAFFAGRELKTVGFAGEIPRLIGRTGTAAGLIGAWHPDGTLIFGEGGSFGLSSIPATGGEPATFAELGEANDIDYPEVLPGGEWVLFTENAATSPGQWSSARILAQNFYSGERRTVLEGGHFARFLAPNHLVFVRNATLFAVAFDPVGLETLGPAVPVVEGVAANEASGHASYAISSNGSLVYVAGSATGNLAGPPRGLVWVDRDGNAETLPLRPDYYSMARISPDGSKIALVVGSTLPASDPLPDIYVYDLETESLTQLTFDTAADDAPVWSRDGSRIFFRSYRESGTTGGAGAIASVYSIPADGGTPQYVASSGLGQNPMPWSVLPDGSSLLLVDAATFEDVNLSTLDVANADSTVSVLDLALNVTDPSLSPDSQWLLYYEFDDSSSEINVRPWPDVRQQRRPVGPGAHPVFSADGSEIFFFDGSGVAAMPVTYSPFRIGTSQRLFSGQYWWGVAGPTGALGRAWDPDPGNDRFLMITASSPEESQSGDALPQRLNVVLNWAEEVRERVPVP